MYFAWRQSWSCKSPHFSVSWTHEKLYFNTKRTLYLLMSEIPDWGSKTKNSSGIILGLPNSWFRLSLFPLHLHSWRRPWSYQPLRTLCLVNQVLFTLWLIKVISWNFASIMYISNLLENKPKSKSRKQCWKYVLNIGRKSSKLSERNEQPPEDSIGARKV